MPEAILLQDVETLGEQGKVIDVSKGYLRNYLIPRKLAQPATRGAIHAIRERKEAAERAERNAVEKAQENVNLLNRTVLMPEPIRNVGTYMVVVEVVPGVTATIKTMVVAKK